MNPIRTLRTLALSLSMLFATSAIAGEVIPRDKLPESIKTTKKAASNKFPGIPSCAKGRVIMRRDDAPVAEWIKAHEQSPCADPDTTDQVYVCASFGKLSVRCE